MAAPKIIIVKESFEYLRKLLKSSTLFMSPRIKMLIELKKHEDTGISKRDLADLIGVNHNSIQAWRTQYLKGGIDLLLSHKRIGYKPSLITAEERDKIEALLSNPSNGIRGYTELHAWVEKELNKKINYNTLYKYCVREFGSGIKVARKSHIRKDMEAVEALKKTSVKSASKQSKLKKTDTKK